MSAPSARGQLAALLGAWLTIDLFGKSRRSGQVGSGTLTTMVFSQGFLAYLFAALALHDVTPVRYLAGTLAMVAGFTALAVLGEVQDQIGHPADRDHVLACPIKTSTFRLARGLHLTLFLAIFCIGLAIAPAVLAYWKTGRLTTVAGFLGCAFVVSATVAGSIQLPVLLVRKLRGAGAAASFSALVRGVLFGAGVFALLLGFRAMHRGAEVFPGGAALLKAMPPYWYARVLDGAAWDSRWSLLAWGAPLGIALLLLAASLLPERRAGRTRSRAGSGIFGRIVDRCVTGPTDRGLLHFTLALLARERSFRLRALPILGLPAAFVILGLRGSSPGADHGLFLALVHNLPLAYLPFFLFFIPYSENWRAAWLLDSTLGDPAAAARRGVALAFAVLFLPLQLLLFAVDAGLRDPLAAAITTGAALGAAWWILPILCSFLEKTPFSEPPEDLAPPGEMGRPAGVGIGVTVVAITVETLPIAARAVIAVLLLGAGIRSLGLHRRAKTSTT